MTSDKAKPVEVRRSTRRRKTVSGRVAEDKIVVMVPAGMSHRAEESAVAAMVKKLERQQRRKAACASMSPEDLWHYARKLDKQYCGGLARPQRVEWSGNITSRWGSCRRDTSTILLHPALAHMPRYVMDYVVVHELCHLTQPGGHTEEFWAAVRCFPEADRSRGYLEAASRYELT